MPTVHKIDSPVGLIDAEFRELADNAPVMIWRARPDKLCDWFNEPWKTFAGKTDEQLFGYGWAEDVHPDDLRRCVCIYETAFNARKPFTMPYRLRRHDGEYRWLLDNGAPYYRGGEFAGYFGSCIDITEQRELQDHQQVLLAELNHRVNNNLQLIISFLALSKAKATGEEAKSLLQSAISRIRGVGLVHDQLHKSSSGTVDLSEYLPELARTVLHAETDGNARLEVTAETITVPFGLASTLGLIVNELVTNSLKHGRAADNGLQLAIEKVGEHAVRIALSDRGPGFAHESTAASGTRKGTGLLDALAKRCGRALVRTNSPGATVSLTLQLQAT